MIWENMQFYHKVKNILERIGLCLPRYAPKDWCSTAWGEESRKVLPTGPNRSMFPKYIVKESVVIPQLWGWVAR